MFCLTWTIRTRELALKMKCLVMSELRVTVTNRFIMFFWSVCSLLALILRTWVGRWSFRQSAPLLVRSSVRTVSALCSSAGCAVKSGDCMPARPCRSYLRRLVSGYMHLWQFVNSVLCCCQWNREHQTPSSACFSWTLGTWFHLKAGFRFNTRPTVSLAWE